MTNRIKTTSTEFSVTTTSQLVLDENLERDFLCIINDSDEVIYLKFGAEAELNKGYRLNANGGTLFMDAAGVEYSALYAIHGGTGTKTLLINED